MEIICPETNLPIWNDAQSSPSISKRNGILLTVGKLTTRCIPIILIEWVLKVSRLRIL